jgi:NADH-quinone oxidoreductase subunit D/NADH-quinone oxidoreductase subunit C/D
LREVAVAARDEFGYDYLSSVTGVDYIDDGKFEVVYHAYRTSGGPALVLKAQTPREEPVVPSLVPVYPGADFQEREVWDMYGVRFDGHPNLRRILMWDGFAGHPLRKDWKEPYFEEDNKPFESRWPGGEVYRAEEKNPFGHNVQYPPDFTVDGWTPESEGAMYAGASALRQAGNGHGLKTDKIVVNLGPQHPSTHGVFRMVVTLNGETIEDLQPVMGYLHRNHEKIGERNTYLQNMPYTDRLDYICSMSNNMGYALAVEHLQKVKVPERAEYLRVLMVELTRICNHLWAIGFLLNDLGAFFTPALYAIKERELILDLFEATAGSRMMCNYMRFGGVYRDLPDKFKDGNTMDFVRDLVHERLPRAVDELDTYLTNNEIIRSRCIGVGVMPPETAIAYSTAGPVLRASAVPYDVRRADPYSIYDRFDFDVAVRPNGDVYDRYLIRIDEIRESLRICQQVVRDMPSGGEIMGGKAQYQVRVPAGESYGRVENPKGELGFYVVSNGKPNPWRYHIRAPSFINLTVMGELCKGHKIADVVVILGSIDIVLGETDR